MIPAKFDYVRADSTDAALGGDHRARRRGQVPRRRHVAPAADEAAPRDPHGAGRRGPVRDLSYVRDGGDHIAIGALTRHRDVETSDLLARDCAVLAAVAGEVGDNQVRHRGTLGGSVAHGDPASDLPAALLALDATFVAQGPSGTRTIAVGDFFQGFLETALAPDELLTEIRVPEVGRQRLRVPEVQPPRPGLGDRRRGSPRTSTVRNTWRW